jgi:hypothetical protein
MDQFAPIRNQIRHARIERSVYVADLIAEFLASATKKIMTLADSIGEGSQKRFHRNVFTFDA